MLIDTAKAKAECSEGGLSIPVIIFMAYFTANVYLFILNVAVAHFDVNALSDVRFLFIVYKSFPPCLL